MCGKNNGSTFLIGFGLGVIVASFISSKTALFLLGALAVILSIVLRRR